MDTLNAFLAHPWAHTLLGCVALALLAWLCAWLIRHVLVRLMRAVSRRTRWRWDNAMIEHGVFRRLAQVVPMLIISHGLRLVPGVPESVETVVLAVTRALIVVFVVLAISAALNALEALWRETPRGRQSPMKGYVQLVKIVLFVIAFILVIAALFSRNPLTLLAGLGAVSAVLLLVFKETILSVVASVQLGTNDMLRVGDWIAVPEDNADGDVIEIALHTVKVLNWDKTISTVPTWHLISKSYRNYRSMYETGRRIARAIDIDLTTVRFLTPDEIGHLRQFRLLDGYFERKETELAEWNASLGEHGKLPLNQRRLSNLGSFRAYIQAYIDAHPQIHHDMLCAVRQLDPGPTGIPLQIYAYTTVTSFVPHNAVQGDIFDHLIAIAPEFGLKLFQQPTGTDLRAGWLNVRPDAPESSARPALDET